MTGVVDYQVFVELFVGSRKMILNAETLLPSAPSTGPTRLDASLPLLWHEGIAFGIEPVLNTYILNFQKTIS